MYLLPIKQTLFFPKNPSINMLNKADSYLLTSIALETLATCSLKKTLINKIWYLPVYFGYGISFYIFPKCFTKYSLSNAYLIWCGLGILLTTSLDILIYKEILTRKKILSLILIILGVKLNK